MFFHVQRQAEERQAESLARLRLESRGALHQAWSEAAEAHRKAASLERRLKDSETSLTSSGLVKVKFEVGEDLGHKNANHNSNFQSATKLRLVGSRGCCPALQMS